MADEGGEEAVANFVKAEDLDCSCVLVVFSSQDTIAILITSAQSLSLEPVQCACFLSVVEGNSSVIGSMMLPAFLLPSRRLLASWLVKWGGA